MLGSMKSPLHRFAKHRAAGSTTPDTMSSNPFESDDESDNKHTLTTSKRTSSEPIPSSITNPFDDGDCGVKGTASSASRYTFGYTQRNKYKNDFYDEGGVENQSVQELENYAVYKAEETTKTVNSCLKIAHDMRDDASKTLVMLHQQGEQLRKTHETAADIDHDLSRGEKLLGSLGGLFSKTWKPKKTRTISGPVITRDDPATRMGGHLEQREKLGLAPLPNGRSTKSRTPPPEPTDALQKVEVEKAKQDDALTDLSDLLGELKGMAVNMGSEIERQNKSLDHLYDDVDELNFRVKNANQRGRRLLGK